MIVLQATSLRMATRRCVCWERLPQHGFPSKILYRTPGESGWVYVLRIRSFAHRVILSKMPGT